MIVSEVARRLSPVATIGALCLALVGCGGGDQGAVIEFPESAAQPVLSESKPAPADAGNMSQGDPSQYTR